jgi:hypothetical protein
VHLNFSKRGTGVSFGTRGAHVSLSPTGRVTKTVSVPGTGIYYRGVSTLHSKSLGAKAKESNSQPEQDSESISQIHQIESSVSAGLSTSAHHFKAVEHHGFYISHGAAAVITLFAAEIMQKNYKQSGISPYAGGILGFFVVTFVLWVRDLVTSTKEGKRHHE